MGSEETPGTGRAQFLEEVFPAELKDIRDRRERIGKHAQVFAALRVDLKHAETEIATRTAQIENLKKRLKSLLEVPPREEAAFRSAQDSIGPARDELLKLEAGLPGLLERSQQARRKLGHTFRSLKFSSVKEREQEPSRPPAWHTAFILRIGAGLAGVGELLSALRQGPRPPEKSDERPSTRHGLSGLAFSGGGIRSATFNLGITQMLARQGVLPEVDYLSTVSGGGIPGFLLELDPEQPERVGPG